MKSGGFRKKLFIFMLAACFLVSALSETSWSGRSIRGPRTPPEESLWIVINIPAYRLTLYQNNKPVKAYKVAVGRSVYRTPRGEWYSTKITWNPSWGPPPSPWAENSSWMSPGPRNPMGNVKISLSNMVYIHGTYKTKSIGTAASHGCIRMLNEDVSELAWTLQSIAGNNNPDRGVEFYQGQRRRSYVLKLDKSVRITSVYETIEVAGDELIIHKDIYRLNKPNLEKALIKLKEAGYNPNTVDTAMIDDAIRQANKKSVRVKIDSLVTAKNKDASKDTVKD